MSEISPYNLIAPDSERVPFVLSIPHCGTDFPPELNGHYEPESVAELDDTDWYLDILYDFASALGVTVIYAKYSRWVIDLNREPNSKPLYDDGRIITALCPTTDFMGRGIYSKKEFEPGFDEIARRLEKYFNPYHSKIDEIINSLKIDFDNVIFWDAHSIRRVVKSIRKEPFPDFILGNNDRKTSGAAFIDAVLGALGSEERSVNHNDPFKGGFLTRSKGNPAAHVHALQLEMSKDLYMTENETVYDPEKSLPIKSVLKSTFEDLISLL